MNARWSSARGRNWVKGAEMGGERRGGTGSRECSGGVWMEGDGGETRLGGEMLAGGSGGQGGRGRGGRGVDGVRGWAEAGQVG